MSKESQPRPGLNWHNVISGQYPGLGIFTAQANSFRTALGTLSVALP